MRTGCAVLVLSMATTTATTGCAVSAEDPGAVGYVLLDHEAQAGRLSQGKWEGAPVLPVALEVEEPVLFTSSAGRSEIALRPGMLAWLHGVGGAIEWLSLREEVSDERLRVYASREAADDLAQRLAGKVEGGGDGLWTIQAPGVFDRGSFLKVPEGVREVSPLPAVDVRGSASGASQRAWVVEGAPLGARQAAMVGVYTAGTRALLLDASGGFTMEDTCSGDVTARGRYRVDEDRVVLEGEGAPVSFALDGGELRDANGQRFTALILDETNDKAEEGER